MGGSAWQPVSLPMKGAQEAPEVMTNLSASVRTTRRVAAGRLLAPTAWPVTGRQSVVNALDFPRRRPWGTRAASVNLLYADIPAGEVAVTTHSIMSSQPSFEAAASIYGAERARKMLAAPGVPTIRSAMQQSSASVFDEQVTLSRESVWTTDALCHPDSRRLYLDVPIRAIIGLGHRNFAEAARTWCDLFSGLHGFGWELDTLAYCESEIGDQDFPAPSALSVLEMQAYGGALFCTNGMHRLTAAVCWLAATQGDNASLKKVRVNLREARPAPHAFVIGEIRRGRAVEVAKTSGVNRYALLRVRNGREDAFFASDGEDILSLKDRRSLIARMASNLRGDAYAKDWSWEPVMPRLIAAMGDDQWLQDQLQHPRYASTPW